MVLCGNACTGESEPRDRSSGGDALPWAEAVLAVSGHRPEILKVRTVLRGRRRSREETFEVNRQLFNGYRVESSALAAKGSDRRDEVDLERFDPPTPKKIERRLRNRHGRRKGRVLKLYQGDSLIAVLACHIDGRGRIVVLLADSSGLVSDRKLQIRLLMKKLSEVNAERAAGFAAKPILWRPHSDQQMRLAGSLGFTEVQTPGQGRELPVLRRPAEKRGTATRRAA